MRLKYSLFSRRTFLNGLLGGWLAALFGSFFYPVIKLLFPPTPEPDRVILPLVDYAGIEEGSVRTFAWGSKPGILKKSTGGEMVAFVGVCTHLDCNVTYLPEQKKFYCACHEGWYDEDGVNVGGPPPRPLRRLSVVIDGENLVVKKEGAA